MRTKAPPYPQSSTREINHRLANLPCCYYLSTPTIKAQQQRKSSDYLPCLSEIVHSIISSHAKQTSIKSSSTQMTRFPKRTSPTAPTTTLAAVAPHLQAVTLKGKYLTRQTALNDIKISASKASRLCLPKY